MNSTAVGIERAPSSGKSNGIGLELCAIYEVIAVDGESLPRKLTIRNSHLPDLQFLRMS